MATIITDATGLNDMRNDLAGDYILGANIDLTDIANWVPIGTAAAPFTGTLNMAGYNISNLTISRSMTDYVGLFGYCRFNNAAKIPAIRNGAISGAVTGRDYVGMLAGYVETMLGDTGLWNEDPSVGALINSIVGIGTVTGDDRVGGLVGMAKGPQFAGHTANTKANSYSLPVYKNWIAQLHDLTCSAVVTGSGENIGGVVGELNEITVELAKSTGEVTGGDKVGGIVGYGYRCAVLYAETTGNITGIKLVGGIMGSGAYRSQIRWCRTEGDITGTGGTYPGQVNAKTAGVGGIAGYMNLEFISDCVVYGDVAAVYRAGGLVGSCDGGNFSSPNIYRCYSRGDVAASQSQVGGLFGFMFAGIVELDQCYCTGSVTGGGAGALIGVRGSYIEYGEEYAIVNPNWDQVQGEVIYQSDCFYNSDVNTANNQFGGVAKTDAELRLDATYETSDEPWLWYDRYWIIDDEEGDYYPQLLCFYEPFGIALACVRGSQGLTLGYVNNGEVFYRQLVSGTWGVETKVENFADVNTINLFRTRDGRIGFLADEGGALEWALTEVASMTIESVRRLTGGYYGDIVHSPDDESYLFCVGEVGSMNQMKGDVSAGWDAVSFGLGDPLPSDSQITRLRVAIFGGDAYLVWRSRGQHRMAKLALAKVETELYRVREGSITMAIDNPIISLSLELDDQEVTV